MRAKCLLSKLVKVFDLDGLGIFPQAVNVAQRCGQQRAGFVDFQAADRRMIGVHRSLVGTFHRLSVGGEFKIADLVGELVILGFKIKLDPADVVLGGVGMRHLLSQRDGDVKYFICATSSGHSITGTCFSAFQSAV